MQSPRTEDPARIGEYTVLGRLGRGAMGTVFLARSPGGRQVAVKVVRSELADDPGFRDRFRQEVAAMRAVGGFWTAAVVDADPDAPQPWLATEYVPGPTLHDVVSTHGPLPPPALRALVAGLAEALRAIHAAGLVHRDLKPANVLLAADGPRVIDFGIAKAMATVGLTATGMFVGTPGFLSPEQIEGRDATPASDVFALGAVLVYAATGAGPFGTGDAAALMYRAVHASPNLDEMPAELRPLVGRCLSRSPGSRPAPAELLSEVGLPEQAEWLPERVRAMVTEQETELGRPMARVPTKHYTRLGPPVGDAAGSPAAGSPSGSGAGESPAAQAAWQGSPESPAAGQPVGSPGAPGQGVPPAAGSGAGESPAAQAAWQGSSGFPAAGQPVGSPGSPAAGQPVGSSGAAGDGVPPAAGLSANSAWRSPESPAGSPANPAVWPGSSPDPGAAPPGSAVPSAGVGYPGMSAVASGVAGADSVASKAVFRTSRVSALVLGAVTTVGAFVCLAIAQESSAARESGAALLFFIAFVLLAVPAARLLWILVRPGRWVEVSGDGITVGKGDRRHELAWHQVARVRVVEDKRRPWLVVWPRDQQAAQIELGGAYSELHGGFRVFPVGHERRRAARAREVRELRAALGWYGRATYDPSP